MITIRFDRGQSVFSAYSAKKALAKLQAATTEMTEVAEIVTFTGRKLTPCELAQRAQAETTVH